MTSYPQQGAPKSPGQTRRWTVVAIAVLAVGLALSGFFLWKAIDSRPSLPKPIGAGPVQLDREGLTIYSTQQVLQPSCQAKDASGADIPLERIQGTEEITVNSSTWYVVLRSADPVPAGAYSVTCTGAEGTYGVGPRASVLGFIGYVLGAIGSFLLFGLTGVLILVLSTVRRRRARAAASTFGAPPPYPGAPQQPYPGAPQQPYPGAPQQPYPGAPQQPYPGAGQQPYPGPPQPYPGPTQPGSTQPGSTDPGQPPQQPRPEDRPR